MNLDKRLLSLAARGKLALLLAIGLGLAGGILTILQAGLLSRIIDQVFLGGANLELVSGFMGILLGVIVIRAGCVWGSEISTSALALRVKKEVRSALYRRIQNLGPAFTTEERTGELVNVTMEGVEALDAYFSQYLPQLALATLIPLAILIFVFPLDWLSGMVLLLTAPLIPLFMILIGSVAQTLTGRQWESLSRMSAYFLDVIQGLTTLKILGRSRAQVQVIEQVNEHFRQATMSVLRVTFLSALVLELVSTLSTAVVAVEVGLRLLYGRLAFEQALFVLILAPEFYLPLRLLGTRFHAGMSGVTAAKRIFEIIDPAIGLMNNGDQQPGVSQPAPPQKPAPAIDLRSTVISLERLAYSYPGERQALREVSFRIEPGQKVALVGPSGAGKSTIASLLLGFIRPQGGIIRVDGLSLSDLPMDAWRNQVAWVPQQPYLFNDTISANLRLAKPEARHDQIVEACLMANLHEFIEGLPQGYDTLIGERAARLSGGQAQRLALARAFLKDTPFLILDEATANLDPEQEALIQDAMRRLLIDRTVLIIAHRLSTVSQADQIMVLEQGRVIEAGTHAQLIERAGVYQHMLHTYRGDSLPTELTATAGPNWMPSAGQLAAASLAASLPDSHHEIPPTTMPQLSSKVDSGEVPEFSAKAASSLHILRRLLLLVKPFSGWSALSTLAGFATVACGVGLLAVSAYIISAAALRPSIAELQVAIVGVRFFGIGRGLFRYLERNLSHEVTFRLLGRLRQDFYRALEPLAPARLMEPRSGDLLARIQGDIATLENFYVRALAPPFVAFLTAAALAVWLGSFSLLLALALAICWLLVGIGLPVLIHFLGRKPSLDLVQSRADLTANLVDSIQGIADLTVFDQAGQQQRLFLELNRHLIETQRRMARLGGLQNALTGALTQMGMWVVLLLAIPLVAGGKIDGVYLAALTLAALTSFEAFAPLPLAAQAFESCLQSARRLYEIVDAKPEIHEPTTPQSIPDNLSVEYKAVSFSYPAKPASRSNTVRSFASTPPALDEISFELPAGKRLAIVGSSGAGKSSLAHLLMRFWELQSGEILVGGQDIRLMDSYDLRSRIGVISQNTYLFAASLRDNLRLARPQATQEEIEQAARAAQLHDFIQTLPQSYDTWIGEQGLRLSAGERQRLAIARMLLKNASLLILDEPTANLDALTERAILQELLALSAGHTTVLITHRLVYLDHFDEILVLRQGRVVERGAYNELLNQASYFRQMWELQSQDLSDRV